MKKLLLAVSATSLMSFGFAAHAVDTAAGQEKFTTVCLACHGANAEGVVGPKLAGQSAEDLASKIHAYKNGEQRGPMTSMMAPMAAGLSEDDIANVTAYIAQTFK